MIREKSIRKTGTCKFPGKKILIVEDKMINREIVKAILQEAEVTVIEAANGRDAVDIVRERTDIDLIFMDIRMPEMTGDVAADLIRKINREDCKGMPIVAMTATASEEEVLCTGINDWMGKPVNPAAVFECLEKYFA